NVLTYRPAIRVQHRINAPRPAVPIELEPAQRRSILPKIASQPIWPGRPILRQIVLIRSRLWWRQELWHELWVSPPILRLRAFRHGIGKLDPSPETAQHSATARPCWGAEEHRCKVRRAAMMIIRQQVTR